MLIFVFTVVAIIGAGFGALVAILLAERRSARALSESSIALAAAQQSAHDLNAQLAVEKSNNMKLGTDSLESARDMATLRERLTSADKQFIEQRKMLDEADIKLRDAFATVSADALQKNNEAFLTLARERFGTLSTEANGALDQRKAQIEGMLKPMSELLNQYQMRLTEIEKSRNESYGELQKHLGTLAETQRTLNTQTNQLVTALRRPTTRGQWGEITLRRIVELAGMSDRCDFCEQISVDTEDGRQRPDMVVNLPGERTLVIDCKAALDAFLDATAAADETQRALHLQRHCAQVRARAKELAGKGYWNQFKRSPEFVVMFLPGEAFLYAAVELDGDLIEQCLKDRVIVATPTTLMALLKAIEFGWRQEQIAANSEEIRKHGRDLYDRLTVLAGHFAKIGASLDNAVTNYNNVVGSMETRVLVTARKIAEMGVGTDRDLPDVEPIDRQVREFSPALRGG